MVQCFQGSLNFDHNYFNWVVFVMLMLSYLTDFYGLRIVSHLYVSCHMTSNGLHMKALVDTRQCPAYDSINMMQSFGNIKIPHLR